MAYKNKEDEKVYKRQYKKDKAKECNKYNRQWHFKDKFNLSHEEWLEMWEYQEEKCAICGIVFPTPSDACVDHDHKTGEIRGLLCRKCNRGIGHFNDDIELVTKAMKYLMEA